MLSMDGTGDNASGPVQSDGQAQPELVATAADDAVEVCYHNPSALNSSQAVHKGFMAAVVRCTLPHLGTNSSTAPP